MTVVTFNIPGLPRGKGRPRFVRAGNWVHTYTDDKTANYENFVRFRASEVAKGEKLQGAIRCIITVGYPIPKSASKKAKEQMINNEVLPQVKPDVDNIAKIILDALNGILYDDDKQIVSLSISKSYSLNPSTEVTLVSII